MAAFRDQMRNLGEQVNIVQLQIGMALVPAISDAAKAISTWLSTGGSQKIVELFKSGADFAQQFGHAIETFVIPGFKAIAGAWGAIPGPLKDLLIGGFIANKAGKFLFDKSLFSGAKGLLGGLLGKVPVVGGAVASGLGVQHVWVDNLGPGGMGGGGIPAAVQAPGPRLDCGCSGRFAALRLVVGRWRLCRSRRSKGLLSADEPRATVGGGARTAPVIRSGADGKRIRGRRRPSRQAIATSTAGVEPSSPMR